MGAKSQAKELRKSKKIELDEDLRRQEIATLKFKMNAQILELRKEELKKGQVEIMKPRDEVNNLNDSMDKGAYHEHLRTRPGGVDSNAKLYIAMKPNA